MARGPNRWQRPKLTGRLTVGGANGRLTPTARWEGVTPTSP